MKYFDEEKNIIKAQAGTSTYYFIRPPEPVVDNTGGLGSAVYHNQSVQRQQEVNKQAAMEAQKQREEAAVRRQPQLRATTKAEQDAARRRTQQYEIQRNLDERAAQVGHSLGANADLNYNQLMANYSAGATSGATLVAPVLTGLTYSGLDFARGNYGWGTAGLGLTFLPGVGPVVKQAATPVIQEAKQAVRQTAQNVKQNVRTAGRELVRVDPTYQPVRIAATNNGYVQLPGGYTQMNIEFHPWKATKALFGVGEGKLVQAATNEATSAVEQAAPKGIQVVDRRGNKKPVFKEGSKEVPVYSDQKVTHTEERPVYGEEQYNEFISPVQSGTTYGGIEFVPGAKPVQRTRTVQTGTEPYEYTTTERVQTGTKTVPNRELVLNDEVLNPATTYYNTKGKQLKKVRTNTGFGYYNLTTGTYQPFSFGDKVLNHYAQHPIRAGIATTLVLSPIVARLTGKGMAPTVNKVTHVVGEEAKRTWLGNEEVDRQNAERAAAVQEAADKEARVADSTRAVNEARERASEGVSSTIDQAQALGNLFKKQ